VGEAGPPGAVAPPVTRRFPGAVPSQLWPQLVAAGRADDPGAFADAVAVTPAACFVRLRGTVMALLARGAVALPFGIRTPIPAAVAPWRALRVGDAVTIRDGRVELPGASLVLRRWWRPPVVRALRGGLALKDGLAALHAALPDAPACRDVDPGAPPARLLGLGPGLTPYGDDVLAGRLIAAVAWGGEVGLASQVRATARAATTAVSEVWLLEAAQGRAVPEAVGLVDAVSAGAPQRVRAALGPLLAVGSTSGHGLAAGILRSGRSAPGQSAVACA
jgi:hypothetical protein